RAEARSFVRFDYTGHGQSDGAFENGTIGDWHRDALTVIDELTKGPLILVGSSMGGWQMLLAALARPNRIAGLVGVAAAPDFTENLMWDTFDQKTRDLLMTAGIVHVPSDYDDSSYPITRALIEDGRNHLVLGSPMTFEGPVRLLHGMDDADVPWQVSLQIAESLTSTDVISTFIKDGDHRLSSETQLARLTVAVEEVAAQIG
ncbi:MAG: alpha/beta hydrolase, partial [Alphaproteobacteria bacterium]|nr:alpha/beta hydrolase [Alphaproteobacteria bacterium]